MDLVRNHKADGNESCTWVKRDKEKHINYLLNLQLNIDKYIYIRVAMDLMWLDGIETRKVMCSSYYSYRHMDFRVVGFS